VQLTLADMAMQVDAARLLRDQALAGLDAGKPSTLHVSLAKCAPNEMAKRVTDMAMMLHRGEWLHREVRPRAHAPRRARLGPGRRHSEHPAHPHRIRTTGRAFDQRPAHTTTPAHGQKD